jgi:hypothetical protein
MLASSYPCSKQLMCRIAMKPTQLRQLQTPDMQRLQSQQVWGPYLTKTSRAQPENKLAAAVNSNLSMRSAGLG